MATEPALPFAPRSYCFFNIRWRGLINAACLQFTFYCPLFSSRMRPDDEPSFSLGRIECRLFHLIYRPWPMHALTPEAPLTTARKERLNELFFSIESDDQPVFLVSLPGLLQKASECLVTAPSHCFFVSFRNHQCPFWNHCFNKQQIMRRRLQNKRASQLRPLNSGRKRQEFL